jgi:hypothetical protein
MKQVFVPECVIWAYKAKDDICTLLR